jgi:hypothetical protein
MPRLPARPCRPSGVRPVVPAVDQLQFVLVVLPDAPRRAVGTAKNLLEPRVGERDNCQARRPDTDV